MIFSEELPGGFIANLAWLTIVDYFKGYGICNEDYDEINF